MIVCRATAEFTSHARGADIIAVDGNTGAGKSTLARTLVSVLGGLHLECDAFVGRPRSPAERDCLYWDTLDYPGMREATAAGSGPLIVDGVGCLEVCDRLGVRPDLRILVANCDPMSVPSVESPDLSFDPMRFDDAVLFDSRWSETDLLWVIESHENSSLVLAKKGRPGYFMLTRSVVPYFKRRRPQITTDVALVRDLGASQ